VPLVLSGCIENPPPADADQVVAGHAYNCRSRKDRTHHKTESMTRQQNPAVQVVHG
jgi:hypothetical protein